MRVKYTIQIILIILIVSGCVPSKTFLDTAKQDKVSWLNNHVKGKKIEITLVNDKKINGRNVTLNSDSLFYGKSRTRQSIALSEIRYITVSPKISVSSLGSLLMVAGGIYEVSTDHLAKSWDGLIFKFYGGIAAIGVGSICFVTSSSSETEVYYFNKKEVQH